MDKFGTKQVEQGSEIDLWQVFEVLWCNKLKIVAITIVFAVGSVFYAISVPNQYKAIALLAPADSDGGGLSSALGQLSGLASLAGVKIGSAEAGEFQIAQEIMKSWSFVENFITENALSIEVYAVNGWDKETNQLKFDNDIFDSALKEWLIEDYDTNTLRPPTSWELFERFEDMLSVTEDKKSGLLTVSVEYYSPIIAKQWLDLYITSINQHMQARQVAKVSNNIDYLEAQIKKTSIAEMREVFYKIIEEQTKNKMVAEASPDFAFVTVSPSMVPEKKSRPKRAIICILVTLFGGMLSVFYVFINHYIRGYFAPKRKTS